MVWGSAHTDQAPVRARISKHACGNIAVKGNLAEPEILRVARQSTSVAACVNGEVRTFFQPCVGPRLAEYALTPLRADTFIFMNYKVGGINATESSHRAMNVRERTMRMLRDVTVRHLSIEPQLSEMPPCNLKYQGAFAGYHQSRGLRQCYETITDKGSPTYEWVLRLRTDHSLAMRFDSLPRIPRRFFLDKPVDGIAILGWLGGCECGWLLPAPCTDLSMCPCVDDQFALLHGNAIRAYLFEWRRHYCSSKNIRCPGCDQAVMRRDQEGLSSECRLGRILTAERVAVRDVRWISVSAHPKIVRRDTQCKHEGWNSALLNAPPVVADAVSLFNLPLGPWDHRRNDHCARKRQNGTWPYCQRYGAHKHDDDARCAACDPGGRRSCKVCPQRPETMGPARAAAHDPSAVCTWSLW